MAKDKNPMSEQDKAVKRLDLDLETDDFTPEQQKKICEMVEDDASTDRQVMQNWVSDTRVDIQQYECEKPSLIENLKKASWQSDRNLGLCPSVIDTYNAVLFATTWNIDSMRAVATEKNDIDNKENFERFGRWVVGPQESNCEPEVDDFIHNKLAHGFSAFYIHWDVWYDWVDKRIPKKDGGYTIKTEEMRFERGVMENIADLEDLLLPRYGCDLQKLPHMIHILHKYAHEILDDGKRNIYMNVDEKTVEKFKGMGLDYKKRDLDREKADSLGLSDVTDKDMKSLPIDLYCWYGNYKKGKRTEKYRFIVELTTMTFLAGKPLRKITRTGKYPFVGGAFIRRPGFVKGKSLVRLISPIVNAFNNIYNQKSDFQYVTNCPFGFYVPNETEGYGQQEYPLVPMTMYPIAEGPLRDNLMFPNIQRSMAWAESDIRILFEMLEKLTGSASYFLTSQSSQSTATRDNIVNERSETRFSLWVRRLQSELCEALTMLMNMYQDWAPPSLGERVLGPEGKQVFKNLSVKTLRGKYDVRMLPDTLAGSKNLERQARMWALETSQGNLWIDPRVNPGGNWEVWAEAYKAMGFLDAEKYLGEKPPKPQGTSQEVSDEWAQMKQGDLVELTPGEDPVEHFLGHSQQKQDKYFELDEEYRKNFDIHYAKTVVQFQNHLIKMQTEKMTDAMASGMVQNRNRSGVVEE